MTHTVPQPWKLAIIHPIQKTPKSTEVSNYRPISILPTIAKITERIVFEQLFEYFTSHHLFTAHQHGFRTGFSTETALLTVTDRVFEAMDRRQVALLCLLDLSKGFDVIPHERLLIKLEQYGVDTRWFSSYLSDHFQQVSVRSQNGRSVLSRPLPNAVGTYQGSALGPLLFNIYTTDLSLYLSDSASYDRCLVQYADDTQLAVMGSPRDAAALVHRLERDLSFLSAWFRKNGLKVNADKTQMIVLGTRQNLRQLPPISVEFMGARVTGTPTVKNLGVTFDQSLTFTDHVTDVVRRATGVLSGLSHCKHSLPRDTLVVLVQALAVSIIRYCISVYGSCGVTQLARIQRLLNFGARVISGRRKYDHISDVLRNLKWLSAENLWRYHSVNLLKRLMVTGQPESLREGIATRGSVHGRTTRQANDLETPVIRAESGRRRFLYSAVTTYNSLPPALRDLGPRQFKAQYRALLLREQYGES